MRAAIYARKSTDQIGAEEARSIPRQIEDARAFAAAKGWTVDEAHVYADDAVSGADTKRLVNRLRLLAAIQAGPPFGAVILRDASRFSRRDGDEAFGELKRITRAGVEVWFTQDGQRFTYGDFGSNVVGFVKAEMNAEYRRQIARWTYDAMLRKAKAGHVTGGRVFGYDNVRQPDRSVIRVIHDAEADVIRQIFTLCVQGHGVRAIAQRLNAEGARCPRAPQDRPAGWSPSSVRDALYRELYHGVVVWNRTKKRSLDGEKHPTARAEGEWLRLDVPELRIVEEELWQDAQTRLRETRAKYLRSTGGRLWGKPLEGVESKYLLPGLARCGICGGGLYVQTRKSGGRRTAFYGCTTYHLKGTRACRNHQVVPMDVIDRAIIGTLLDTLFERAFLADVLARVHDELIPAAARGLDRLGQVEAALQTLDREIDTLTSAIARMGYSEAVVQALQDREQRRAALRQEQQTLQRAAQGDTLDTRLLDGQIEARLDNWRGLLARQTPQARQLLRKVVQGPIVATPLPEAGQWELSLTGSLDKVWIGLLPDASSVASPPGEREACTGSDAARSVASPTGFEPVFWP